MLALGKRSRARLLCFLKNVKDRIPPKWRISGEYRSRTDDPLLAKQVL